MQCRSPRAAGTCLQWSTCCWVHATAAVPASACALVHACTAFLTLLWSPTLFRRAQRSAPASWRTNTGAMHTQTTFFALLSQTVYIAVLLLQGPEIRTGFLENEQPVLLEAGHELTVTTDYSIKVGRVFQCSWSVVCGTILGGRQHDRSSPLITASRWALGMHFGTCAAVCQLSTASAAATARTSAHTSCMPPVPSGTDLTSPLLHWSLPRGATRTLFCVKCMPAQCLRSNE